MDKKETLKLRLSRKLPLPNGMRSSLCEYILWQHLLPLLHDQCVYTVKHMYISSACCTYMIISSQYLICLIVVFHSLSLVTSNSKVQLLVSSQTTSITTLFSAHYGVATFYIGKLVAQHGLNCKCVRIASPF